MLSLPYMGRHGNDIRGMYRAFLDPEYRKERAPKDRENLQRNLSTGRLLFVIFLIMFAMVVILNLTGHLSLPYVPTIH